jgi:hypothetical protein
VPAPSRAIWHGVFLVTAIAGACVLSLISLRQSRQQLLSPSNRPIAAETSNYVTSAACRACHPGNYASWHASFHRTMTQVATSETVIGATDQLELSFNRRQYKMERHGDKFFVRTRPIGESEYGDPREVVLLTGSHNLQILWTETGQGRTLEQFPFAYIVGEKMWAPVSETFLFPPELKEYYSIGAWNGACMDCHVTQGQSRFVRENKWDSQVAEFGIACEACHSEGHDHIALNRNPLRRFKLHLGSRTDPSMTNPARLSGPASGLDCGQCHSVWAFKDMSDKIDFNLHGRKFRPGDNDLAQRFVVQPSSPDYREQKEFIRRGEPDYYSNRFWGDGMIRVTGREFNGLETSPCFRGGKFSCISCHEMHLEDPKQVSLTKWTGSAQLRAKMDSDEACLQCHEQMRTQISAHTHHPIDSSGSRCYNCHMPRTTFGLLRAMRSHQVSTPSVRESADYGRPNACNLCHLDKTLAWTADKLHLWFNQPEPKLSEDDRKVAAAVQWIVKGDAGQRALLAWGMGWSPAQEVSGRDWLYPYLIYTLTDRYAAVRFDAWKSLQTLPGFSNFAFTYTEDESSLTRAAARALDHWSREVRPQNAVFPPESALDVQGRPDRDVFSRLRDARDEKPIVLAE